MYDVSRTFPTEASNINTATRSFPIYNSPDPLPIIVIIILRTHRHLPLFQLWQSASHPP
jgi:hypothetical protein